VDDSLMLLPTPLYPVHRLSFPYHGLPGKGSAFRLVFEMARRLQARACAVVDSDLRSITPEWIDLLIRPVLLGKYDFVAPYYHRHKYDGTITNSIVYPLTRMLYGVQVRQPIGGDFGVSPALIDCYLKKDVWETDVARFGIDIWMTTVAVAEGFRVCQSFLGAKLHDAKDPAADLSAMLQQVVGSVFDLMQEYEKVWREKQGSCSVPLFGFRFGVGLDPIHVDVDRMLREFRRGSAELGDIWSVGMQRGTLSEIRRLASETEENPVFHLEDGLWAKVVLDFSMAYRVNPLLRGPLLRSLTPLYLARVASFVKETESLAADDVEERMEALCSSFESLKPYLISLWSGAPIQESAPGQDQGKSQLPGSGGKNAVEVGNV
jgi:hypothetical protein